MYLALQITGPNAAAMGQNASKVFSEAGGTIGRAGGNDWVLRDEDRFISGRHAIIRFMSGMFSLEDVSTNGVYINGEPNTVGSGNDPVILKSGDRIQIGDYEIYASVVEDDASVAPPPQATAPPPQGMAPEPDPVLTSPTGYPTSPPTTPGTSTLGPLDPLELLGKAPPQPAPVPPAMSDHSPAMSDHFSPPGGAGTGAAGGIPDDWDLTDFSASGTRPVIDPSLAPPIPTLDIAPGPPQDAVPMAAPVAAGALPDQLMALIVQGMMDVLKSRAEIKSQFRLSLTTIKPVENNPLKFSPNVEDALGHLFTDRTKGYLGPSDAFAEGFNDIKAHQMAMLAGMRAAFEHMLEQFSPEILEKHFEGGAKRGKILGMGSKARYWDLYRDMFDKMTRDSDDNFRKLFGEEFASAYEQQMQKLTKSL